MNYLRYFRNEFIKVASEKRWKRIAVIAFGLAIYWCFIEWITIGQLKPNYWHDVICIGIAIVVERCLPWGKKVIKLTELKGE